MDGVELPLSEDKTLETGRVPGHRSSLSLDEPVDYGPMRLLSVAERICSRAAPRCEDATVCAIFLKNRSWVQPSHEFWSRQVGAERGEP